MNPDDVAICIREDGETLPLMVRPVEENNSPEFLRNWIAKNKQWLDGKLLEHGVRKYRFACIKINAFVLAYIVWIYENIIIIYFFILGAILFEGFDVKEGIEFQEIVQSFNPDLSDEYRGTSPRKLIPGTKVQYSINIRMK